PLKKSASKSSIQITTRTLVEVRILLMLHYVRFMIKKLWCTPKVGQHNLQNGNLIMVTKERSPHWICSDNWGQEANLWSIQGRTSQLLHTSYLKIGVSCT